MSRINLILLTKEEKLLPEDGTVHLFQGNIVLKLVVDTSIYFKNKVIKQFCSYCTRTLYTYTWVKLWNCAKMLIWLRIPRGL